MLVIDELPVRVPHEGEGKVEVLPVRVPHEGEGKVERFEDRDIAGEAENVLIKEDDTEIEEDKEGEPEEEGDAEVVIDSVGTLNSPMFCVFLAVVTVVKPRKLGRTQSTASDVGSAQATA